MPKSHPLLTQRVGSILGLLNAAGLSLRVQLARLRRIAARSVCSPCGKNEGIICLREHEARLCAARLDSALEHYPRPTDISLAEQGAGARQQPGRFRTALRLSGRWLLCRSRLRGLRHLGDRAVRRAFDRNARPDRGLRGFTTRRQGLGPVALLLQRLSQLRLRTLGSLLELLELRRLVARLARQRHLRLDVTLRPRKLARQCL